MKYVAPTKIICTLGPASNTEGVIMQMIDEGMSIARINLSHSTESSSSALLDMLNRIRSKKEYMSLGVAMDTKGPEIRIGTFPESKVKVQSKDKIIITTDEKYRDACTKEKIFVDHSGIYSDLTKESKVIYIDDGKIELQILEVAEERQEIITEVKNSGEISSKKGVNIPHAHISLPALSRNDEKSIELGVQHGIDFIFASFIRSKEDVKVIRAEIKKTAKDSQVKIIAKIENTQGLENLQEIIEESDGVMVARGDLGVEIPYETLFPAQCRISNECKLQNKPFIIATEVLESMINAVKPTRAEITDLSFAVLCGAGCVMLSGESAMGIDPVNTVKVMHKIIKSVSESFSTDLYKSMPLPKKEMIIFVSETLSKVRSKNILFGYYAEHKSSYNRNNLVLPLGYSITEEIE